MGFYQGSIPLYLKPVGASGSLVFGVEKGKKPVRGYWIKPLLAAFHDGIMLRSRTEWLSVTAKTGGIGYDETNG